jgi:hypothetical protein
MNGIRTGVEVNGMSNIPRQKQQSHEVSGFHTRSLPPRQRSFNFKGLALYTGGA